MSIGARSQSAHTHLERHTSEFMECNLNELVQHDLPALRETLPAEQDLTTKNVSIGTVGKDLEFTICDDGDVSPFLEGLEERPQRKAQPAQPADESAEKADETMAH
ncbi:Proteasome subunit alpha type-1 [Fukomys damarensis]|uniref:Proteasome subunit alpha type-1 n=1 Tax=Fukomys damarensis TaxID=885580 RepID=A0A091CSX4_FUKDA|nr:Proteasome subunit alpha type-1 [Fukomys damarensis]